jgi:hypothetical protein
MESGKDNQQVTVNTGEERRSPGIPNDGSPFNPTRVYWISPQQLRKEITILDLTEHLPGPFNGFTPEYKERVKATLKDHTIDPIFTVHRDSRVSLKYTVDNSQGDLVANWKHTRTGLGEAILTFPENSQHSLHPIHLKAKSHNTRTEAFTVNSVPFLWEQDSFWNCTNMTLYKVVGSGEHEKKSVVGKYAQRWWGSAGTGGTFVVDENELDGLVACLSLLVFLKKMRQNGEKMT